MFFYKNNFISILDLIKFYLNQEKKIIFLIDKKNIIFFFFIPLFMFILYRNCIGLLPFVFTSTRQIRLSFSLSLPLWLRLILIAFKKLINFFSHLVPYGCPRVLMPFMVLIELIRLLIRPITLAVRLSANIIAGHLIMTLVRIGSFINSFVLIFSIFAEIIIRVLEIRVAFIQPYVFFILLTLYREEN